MRLILPLFSGIVYAIIFIDRLEIINTLRETEMNVTKLSARIGIDMGNLSQHLGMMRYRRILPPGKKETLSITGW